MNAFGIKQIENGLAVGKLTAYMLKSAEGSFFSYWNNAINDDVELFWEAINRDNLPYQRKSPIRYLLDKGHFRQVEQWIDLVNNFDELQTSGYLERQFSEQEITRIIELIQNEEKKRVALIKKYFQKKKIPFSQYLKFGENMAFLESCNLLMKYFNEKEKEEIYQMWLPT